MSTLRRAVLAALLVSVAILPGCDIPGLVLVDVVQGESVIFSGGLFDFGDRMPGAAHAVVFQIANHGQADVTLPGTVEVSGPDAADFAVTVQPDAVIPAGGTVSFTVAFTPSAYDLERAQARFETGTGTYLVNLVGRGTGFSGALSMEFNGDGWLTLSPGETVNLTSFEGEPVAMQFRINNTDLAENLYLRGSSGVVIAGADNAFTLSVSPVPPVAPDSFTDFEITFTPPDYGTFPVSVTVQTTDPDFPDFTFTIQGEYQMPVF